MKVLFASVLLVLSTFCFIRTDGLECYTCGYIEGHDLPGAECFLHQSCETGKKPDIDFIKSCEELFPTVKELSCGKLVFSGDVSPSRLMVNLTVRACLPAATTDKCEEGKIADITKIFTGMPEQLQGMFAEIGQQKATLCSCDSDKCNSSSMVKLSHGVWMLSLALLASGSFLTLFKQLNNQI